MKDVINIIWHVETFYKDGEIGLWQPEKNTRASARIMRDRMKNRSYMYKKVRIVKFVRQS